MRRRRERGRGGVILLGLLDRVFFGVLGAHHGRDEAVRFCAWIVRIVLVLV